jgi:quinohemoprotein ethanol dehydrogenase
LFRYEFQSVSAVSTVICDLSVFETVSDGNVTGLPFKKMVRSVGLLLAHTLSASVLFSAANATAANADNTREIQANITTKRLLDSYAAPNDWLMGGRDYQQSYYSPLTSLSRENIGQLGFAWQYEIATKDGFEATPIVVDGVMFTSGPRGAVYVLDAKTGSELWTFKPDIDVSVVGKICCGPVNRGVAVWQGLVYVASLDGFLYALDASTGAVRWKVDTITDRARGYSVTGAPYIADGLVIIGNSGADYDARGYITAYDARNGQQHWRFFTVPGDPAQGFEQPELAMAAKTWDPNSLWKVGLGGTVWDGMAYDPKLNLLYIGTDNGNPYPQTLRSPSGGANLFISSILAINPDTGRLIWFYQTTPADKWDYSSVQKMILADLIIGGRQRQVLMQAPKNGFFYVLDRRSGQLISAKPYARVTWASGIDNRTGKPIETDQGNYVEHPKLVFPSWYGAHNWQPMAFNPGTGLVYIPAMEAGIIFTAEPQPFVYERGATNNSANAFLAIAGPMGLGSAGAKDLPPLNTLMKGQPDPTPRGFLRAWDPIHQHLVWELETSGPWAGGPSAMWNGGGVMTTAAGLVFQGRSTGQLVILDAGSGKTLHVIDVGTGMMAAPMTYMVDGVQYVAIMAGTGGTLGGLHPSGSAAYRFGNRGRIVAFKLGGGTVPHPNEISHETQDFGVPPLPRRGPPAMIGRGAELFARHCSKCHTNSGDGNIPDLRRMSASTHAEFPDILLKGTRVARGMGNFGALLSGDQVEALHDYLIDLQWQMYELSHADPVHH